MKKCPICKKLFDDRENNEYFPFDKEICRDLDLYYWLSGDYCIFEELVPNADEDPSEPFWRN